jgi:3-polyprenyl-4-hydroxybenzoate decarboxylase
MISVQKSTMLENEPKLTRCDVMIVDTNPRFYSKPKTVDDVTSFIDERCPDRLKIEQTLYNKWSRFLSICSYFHSIFDFRPML